MDPDSEAVKGSDADAEASDLQQGIFFILKGIFEKIHPLVLAICALALTGSLLQTLQGKASPPFFLAQILLFLGFAVVTLLRRRLSSILVFSLIMGLVYVLAVISLFNRGLAGSGNIHMIFFCVFAGTFLSLRSSLTILTFGMATVFLMGIGFTSGIFPAKPDSAAYLLHPINWLLQIACIALYAIPLIFCTRGLLRKIADSQAALQETNYRLSEEVIVRQRTEERLRDSEEKYRKMFENAVEGIFQISTRGRLLSANPALVQMLGYASPEEMLAEVTDVRNHGYIETKDRQALVRQMKRNGGVIGRENRLFRKDGSMAWVSINCRAVRDADGKVHCYEGSIEDITKRKEAEQALIQSEANYRSIVESSVAGFFTVQGGMFRFINRRASEIMGYDYDEVVNLMQAVEPIHPDDQGLVEEHLARCLAEDGAMFPFTARIVCKNGKIITARYLIGRTLYHDAPAVSGTFIDITREQSLETQLRQAQKMEAVGQLASGVAHDFNNILTAFNGYGRLLQIKTPQEDPRRNYVDQILAAARKAESLTQNLLTFSRQQPITLAPLDLNHHIRETEKLLRRLLTEDIAFTIFLSPEPITTMSDATQIDRILFNLVSNARDAMPQGGSLRLETGMVVLDEDFREYHGFGKPGRYACLSLADTGIGMEKKTLEQIFHPFFTTKEPGQGTGLGLATVYGIVKQHDGYVTVNSTVGQGATFRVYLPTIQTVAVDQQPCPPEALPEGRETILVADDDEAVRSFIRDVFDLSGYQTIEAIDGEDAVCKFRETPSVAMVVLDTVMPKMNGSDAYEAMKRENPSLKSLFISGYTQNIILNKGVRDKAFNFLPKPLLPATLLAKVREVLDRQ